MQGPKIEKVIFWVTFGGVLCLVAPLLLFPSGGEQALGDAKNWVTRNLGWTHLWFFVASTGFLFYVALGKYGRIRFGGADSTPEFSLFSWGSMLFCAGIGASVIYWGTIEWAYYYVSPPFDAEPGSREAIRWAAAYGMFHWGPLAWAVYCVPALPLGYLYWNRGRSVLRLSAACEGVIGARAAAGLPGKIIDIAFILGMLGGVGTSVGLSTPLISAGIAELFDLERTFILDATVIVIWSALFGFSVYSGLKKGIKILSDLNTWLVLALMAFVLIFGPTLFIVDSFTDSVGKVFQHFIAMSFHVDAVARAGDAIAASGVASGDSSVFSENWTIFYWAWWVAYAPFMGLFVARISRGRTLREVIFGEIIAGSLGCWIVFGVLGNTGLFFELEGSQNLTGMVLAGEAPEAIIATIAAVGDRAILFAAPLVALFVVLSFIFGATTMDSASYVLAAVATKEQGVGAVEPARWHRLFWAVVLAVVSLALMFVGGQDSIEALKASSILVSVPLMVILALLAVSFMKWIREDTP